MLKAFKYRLYPTKDQATLINKHIGAARFVYNLGLETKTTAYAAHKVNLTCFDLIKQIPELKKECAWLKEINSQSLQMALRNLDNAYTNFFHGRGEFPKYKSKGKGKQAFNIPQNVKVEDGKLDIPKFKKSKKKDNRIKINLHRPLKGEIRSATISRTPTGKYFVSILCETGEAKITPAPINQENTVGFDLGLKEFLISSEGEIIENPRYLRKAEAKLKYVQRKYSKHKGQRTKHKLAKLYEKVVNQRKDFLHKVSSKIVSENQTIAIENLNVAGMLKNHTLAKSIQDAGWGMFTTMLTYKADWYGSTIIQIGRFEPSSKTCSCCGTINKELKLSDREWTCNNCGTTHDRDVNAAINIKNFALRNTLSGTDSENHGELPTLVGVLTHEAYPIASGVGG